MQKTKAPAKTMSKKVSTLAGGKTTKKMTQSSLNLKTTLTTKRARPTSDDEQSDTDQKRLGDNSQLDNTPPKEKKQKKAPVKKGTITKPLQIIENDETAIEGSEDPKSKKGSGATDKYQKALTPVNLL